MTKVSRVTETIDEYNYTFPICRRVYNAITVSVLNPSRSFLNIVAAQDGTNPIALISVGI